MAGAEVSQAARPMLQLRSAGAVRSICAGRLETGEDLQRAGGMHVMLQLGGALVDTPRCQL
jgi:hypothetical protein